MTLPAGMGYVDFACLCSLDVNENIVAYNAMCPLHKHLATPPKTIHQPWCSGSSKTVIRGDNPRTGYCTYCQHVVPQKYGYAGIHLRDGTTPRE